MRACACLSQIPASFWASSYRWHPAIVGRYWDSVGVSFTSGSSKLQHHTVHTDFDEVGHKVSDFDLAGRTITRSYAKPLYLPICNSLSIQVMRVALCLVTCSFCSGISTFLSPAHWCLSLHKEARGEQTYSFVFPQARYPIIFNVPLP